MYKNTSIPNYGEHPTIGTRVHECRCRDDIHTMDLECTHKIALTKGERERESAR